MKVAKGVLAWAALGSGLLLGVPASFLLLPEGNQRDVDWKRLETKRFAVYHASDSLPLATAALSAVESAYPHLAALLGVQLPGEPPLREPHLTARFPQIPLILSTRTEAACWVNIATENIELHLKTGAPSSLYQHELVHRLMYEHLDPGLGLAGRAGLLGLLPTWWTEGLPEHLTESIGRLETQAVLRTMVREARPMSFDQLHALYNVSGPTALRGYAVSGQFFRFLMGEAGKGDLYTVHRELARELTSPRFLWGTDHWVATQTGLGPRELYGKFWKAQESYWTKHLGDMPALASGEPLLKWQGLGTRAVREDGRGVPVASFLHGPPWVSHVQSGAVRTQWNLSGSSVFGLGPHTLWTAERERFANGTSGTHLVVADRARPRSPGARRIPWSSEQAGAMIEHVEPISDVRAFVLSNLRGTESVTEVDVSSGAKRSLGEWASPATARILGAAGRCVWILVDEDLERTSLEKRCAGEPVSVVIPPGSLYLKGGFVRADGSGALLVGWGDILGLVRLRGGSTWEPVGPLPEWVTDIAPSRQGAEGLFASVVRGEETWVHHVDLREFGARSRAWAASLPWSSPWARFPASPPYVAPFELLSGLTPREAALVHEGKGAGGPASARHRFWFAYPVVVPPQLGGWTAGVLSVPWQDEMERNRVEVQIDYAAPPVDFLSGRVSYVDQRILGGVTASAFSRAHFGGVAYLQPCTRGWCTSPARVNDLWQTSVILQERGASVGAELPFPLSKVSASGLGEVVRRTPGWGPRDAFLGPQDALLLRGALGAGWRFGEVAFAGPQERDGQALWHQRLSARAEVLGSLGAVRTGMGNPAPPVQGLRTVLGFTSSLDLPKGGVAYAASWSRWQGEGLFLEREIYQPFATFLVGSTSDLNGLSYFLGGSPALGALRQGNSRISQRLAYSTPLLPLDRALSLLYLTSLDGEVSLARGGVTDGPRGEFRQQTSATAALQVALDIKGVQLFPGVAWGYLPATGDNALFFQFSYTQLF